ncbi:MAG: prenyltransferase, partial [Rhodobacteraceae bacterium]|nr:prenyltransferase [Paracoccaceae bacterium]
MNHYSSQKNPLVVDADGTLLATDMLFECFWAALGKNPIACLKAGFSNLNSIARLKQEMAKIAGLDVTSLPVRPEVLALCKAAKSESRTVIIASGSDRSLVAALSKSVGFGDDYLASDGQTNLTSTRKSDALVARF